MQQTSTLLQAVADLLGADCLLTDDESRTFFSTDVFRQADELAVAVAQPGTVEELQQLVRICAEHRAPMVARGGAVFHYAVNCGSGLCGVSAGSGGGEGNMPFIRFYGPDLAGLFVGDAGALV